MGADRLPPALAACTRARRLARDIPTAAADYIKGNVTVTVTEVKHG